MSQSSSSQVEYVTLYDFSQSASADGGLFIPDFQRGYVWKWEANALKLFTDLIVSTLHNIKLCDQEKLFTEKFLAGSCRSKDKEALVAKKYDIGFMVYVKSIEQLAKYEASDDLNSIVKQEEDEEGEVFSIIDGQQRLSTLILLARALYNVLSERFDSVKRKSLTDEVLSDLAKVFSLGGDVDDDKVTDDCECTLKLSQSSPNQAASLQEIQCLGKSSIESNYKLVFDRFESLVAPAKSDDENKSGSTPEIEFLQNKVNEILWTPTDKIFQWLREEEVELGNEFSEVYALCEKHKKDTAVGNPLIIYVAHNLLHSIGLVTLESPNMQSAIKMFERLNSAGVRLLNTDIIKSRLFFCLPKSAEKKEGELTRSEFIERWNNIQDTLRKSSQKSRTFASLLEPICYYHNLKGFNDKGRIDSSFEGLGVQRFFSNSNFSSEQILSFLEQAELNVALLSFVFNPLQEVKHAELSKLLAKLSLEQKTKIQNLLFALFFFDNPYVRIPIYVYFWNLVQNIKLQDLLQSIDGENIIRFLRKHLTNFMLNYTRFRRKSTHYYLPVRTSINILATQADLGNFCFDKYAFESMAYLNADSKPENAVYPGQQPPEKDSEVRLKHVTTVEDFLTLESHDPFVIAAFEVVQRFAVLEGQEAFNFNSNKAFIYNEEGFEIEHICANKGDYDMSQEEWDEFAPHKEKLGNKMLLERKINREKGNNTTPSKIEGYNRSQLRGPKLIKENLSKFREEQVKERGKALYDFLDKFIDDSQKLYYSDKKLLSNYPIEKQRVDLWLEQAK